MAKFLEEIWESVFTPGPAPASLKALNMGFGSLEVVLLGLLALTKSVHCIIMGILTGGLWWAVNWFTREWLEAQKTKEREEATAKQRTGEKARTGEAASGLGKSTFELVKDARASDSENAEVVAGEDDMDSGDDTEVELEQNKRDRGVLKADAARASSSSYSSALSSSTAAASTGSADSRDGGMRSEGGAAARQTSAASKLVPENKEQGRREGGELRERKRESLAGSTGSLSTDSEWEKIGEEER